HATRPVVDRVGDRRGAIVRPRRRSVPDGQVRPAGSSVLMATREEYARLPLAQRLSRMTSTADELVTAIRGRDAGALARRPDAKSWAPVEIVCHLRDIEELAMMRFRMMLAMDEPKVL